MYAIFIASMLLNLSYKYNKKVITYAHLEFKMGRMVKGVSPNLNENYFINVQLPSQFKSQREKHI